MAKGTFHCGECGRTLSCWGRNRAEADRKAAWHESVGTFCDTCQEKKNAAENTASADANAAAGLPSLKGSEKQVAWAETIRRNIFSSLDEALVIAKAENREAELNKYPAHGETLELGRNARMVGAMLDCKYGERTVEAFLRIARRQTEASWWIERGRSGLKSLVMDLEREIEDEIIGQKPKPAEQVEAEEESLLRPAGEPQSASIVEVKWLEPLVVLEFPKIEIACEVARRLTFRWKEPRWERPMTEMTGDPLDRMAETAQRFLEAGFMVRLYNDEARRRTVKNDFQPEQRRWLSVSRLRFGEPCLCARWSLRDDFYEAAKRIPGARPERLSGRRRTTMFHIPLKYVSEAAEFAKEYGFSMTREVSELLGRHEAAVDEATIVAEFKKRPPRVTVRDEIPDLAVPESVDIAQSLRDEDD